MNYCLGLSGQKQTGKDTAAQILIPILSEEMSKKFVRAAFADEVKRILCLFSYQDANTGNRPRVVPEFIEEYKERADFIPGGWKMNVRQALINIGDRFREIYPEIWMDLVLCNPKNKVITDVRYENEAWAIRQNSRGFLVRIVRPELENNINDKSETSLLKYDKMVEGKEGPINIEGVPYNYILRNDGSLERYEQKVRTELVPHLLNSWKYFA